MSKNPFDNKESSYDSLFARHSSSNISYVTLAESKAEELSEDEEFSLKRLQTIRTQKSECIIPSDHSWKTRWDLWIVIVLFFVAITLPYRIAFAEKDSTVWQVINYVIDVSFAVDMVLTFFTTIPDTENNLIITNKKTIALAYIKSWFFIDLISIIPLDKFIHNASSKLTQLTKFSRFTRFSRLLRLFRIIRMAKILRICKDRKRIQNQTSMIKLDPNLERILLFLVVILFINHVMACFWVIAAKVNENLNWIRIYEDRNGSSKFKDYELYLTSFYFVSTTVTTVGYGDISP